MKLKFIWLLPLALTFFTACSDDDDPNEGNSVNGTYMGSLNSQTTASPDTHTEVYVKNTMSEYQTKYGGYLSVVTDILSSPIEYDNELLFTLILKDKEAKLNRQQVNTTVYQIDTVKVYSLQFTAGDYGSYVVKANGIFEDGANVLPLDNFIYTLNAKIDGSKSKTTSKSTTINYMMTGTYDPTATTFTLTGDEGYSYTCTANSNNTFIIERIGASSEDKERVALYKIK